MLEGEEQIIGRARQGDLQAFHALMDAHAKYAFRVAYGLLGSVSDAEDVVQETFLAAFKGIGRFEQRAGFRTWLIGILARQAALWRRRRRPTMRLVRDEHDRPAQGGEGAVDARLDVATVLAQLPEEYRDVLVLRELEGMSYEAIAAALDIPKGTVESRLFRARGQLKAKLPAYRDEKKP